MVRTSKNLELDQKQAEGQNQDKRSAHSTDSSLAISFNATLGSNKDLVQA